MGQVEATTILRNATTEGTSSPYGALAPSRAPYRILIRDTARHSQSICRYGLRSSDHHRRCATLPHPLAVRYDLAPLPPEQRSSPTALEACHRRCGAIEPPNSGWLITDTETVLPGEGENAPPAEVVVPGVTPPAGAVIRMLGDDRALVWTVRGDDLVVEIPAELRAALPCDHAWGLRIPD